MSEEKCTEGRTLGGVLKGVTGRLTEKDQPQDQQKKERILEHVSNFDWNVNTDKDVAGNDSRFSNRKELLEDLSKWSSKILLGRNDVDGCHYEPHNIFILGASGIGKTHMSKRAMYLTKGYTINIPHFYNVMRNSGNWELIDQTINSKMQQPILMDDFKKMGSEGSSYLSEKMYHWLEKLSRRWVIWTSNYDLAQITDDFGAQISSRMKRDGNVIIEMNKKIRDYND